MNRWTILVVLFLARTAMAFQFQAVAALSPVFAEVYSIGLAEIGLLIGLYLAPGILVAIPGSTLAARFGDRRIVIAALLMMLCGNLIALAFSSYEAFIAARLVAGAGGVVVNIVMTKLLVDWFAGREISTALAIFVNSWPAGIALALLLLPIAAERGGLLAASLTVTAVIVLGLLAFGLFYRAPEGLDATPPQLNLSGLPYVPLIAAGLVWAFYNAALAMVFSFAPALFIERGWSLQGAGSMTSLFMVIFAATVPLGGILADRTGRRDLIIAGSLVGFGVLMPLATSLSGLSLMVVFCVVAATFSLCAGPVMALPSAVLAPANRTFGMGVFFTIYYAVMMVAPRLAGGLADKTGAATTAIWSGAVMCALALAALVAFRATARPSG